MLKLDGIEIKHLAVEMTDEEFFQFCQANRDLRIERDREKNILIMTPVGFESGFFENELLGELRRWNQASKLGIAASSSTGFLLPNGAVRAPDASWISNERWRALSEEDKKHFPPLIPDFVAEIRSESDVLPILQEKMREYMEQGARLGWLLDPQEKAAYIYHADGTVQKLEGWTQALSGGAVLPGFEFDLEGLRLPE
ncbi:MAG: Uma2 family endonuclease [Lewinellaceae bacterium]|nr:Uma2 family endonuclease [Lewinellaceae bacterium]